jgi:hypothetical protein
MGAAAAYDPEQCTLTAPDGPLDAAQRRSYERDGFLIVRGVFRPADRQTTGILFNV